MALRPTSPVRAPSSPRRHPVPRRRAGSPTVSRVSGANDTNANATAAVATSSAMVFASTFRADSSRQEEGSNPLVHAIQSRVADVVRRYDESVADDRDNDDDDDDSRVHVPVRWRVGDVLLAAHSSLAKTGARTAEAIVAEFPDNDGDPDVVTALETGATDFGRLVHEAARHTQQVQDLLTRTIAMVHQLQATDAAQTQDDARTHDAHGQRVRELRATLDALQREKAVVLRQLQDHIRAHKDVVAAMDTQHQELARAHVAVAMTRDDAAARADEYERRLSDAQRALDTSQQSVGTWRDKCHAATKSLATAEQRVAELETKTVAQAEAIVKHEVVLLAKGQEEKAREKLKESELQRLRRDVAAAAQALADSNECHEAAKRAEEESSKKASSDHQTALVAKKLQDAERTVLELRATLADARHAQRQLESDNAGLSTLVREMKARVGDAMTTKTTPSPVEPTKSSVGGAGMRMKKATSFAISLRALTHRRRSRRHDARNSSRGFDDDDDDDLSTSSDDSDSDTETAQVEKDLNATVEQVVTAAFPHHVPTLEQSDERITRDIARYEDPTLQPLHDVLDAATTVVSPLLSSGSVSVSDRTSASESESVLSPPTPHAPMTQVERMKLACDDELARMKQQYVAGLVEYKRLILEQFERRQAQLHEHHRVEIERLLLLVQDQFKRELEKHGEKMMRAKESLKLLYRVMNLDGDRAPERARERASDEGEAAPVPLKALLRAAVFALSSSTKRSEVASAEIQTLYERAKRRKADDASGRGRAASSVTVLATPTVSAVTEAPPLAAAVAVAVVHVSCQANDADFALLDFARGFRGSAVAPERMDGVMLSSTGQLVGNQTPCRRHHSPHERPSLRRRRRPDDDDNNGRGSATGLVLHLVAGAAFSDALVRELRDVVPTLPTGAYFLSAALQQKLLLELLRFYAAWDVRQCRLPSVVARTPDGPRVRDDDSVDVVVGSPRDTPFMRRKALESVQKLKARQRRGLVALASSGPSDVGVVAWPSPRSLPL